MSKLNLSLVLSAIGAGAVADALGKIGASAGRVQQQISAASAVQQQLGIRIAALGTQGAAADGLKRRYDSLTGAIDRARAATDQLAAAKARMNGHAEAIGGLKADALAVAGLAISLGAPVKVAADFERSMARVGAVSRASAEDLQRLTATARELGARTSFSASQAAEGMQFLAMAGFSVDQTISAMPGMLNLAAAGAIDLGRAADIASNILTGFGLSADEMGRVGDVLVNTFTRSNVDLNMLGESMKYAAPVARALGLSIEETAAMVGKLGDAGIQGSMAGTALRAMLLRLSSERGAVQKELQAYGIAIADAQGNLKSLPSLLAEIQAKTSHLGSQEAAKVLSQIFGQEAVGAALALMEQASSGALQTLIDQTQEAGAAQRVAADMTRNAHGEWTRLKSVLESISITLGNTLLPVLTELLQAVQTRVLQPLDAWMSRNERLVGVIAKAAAALLVFKTGLLAAKFAFHGVGFVVGSVTVAFAQLRTVIASVRLAWQVLMVTGLPAVKSMLVGLYMKSVLLAGGLKAVGAAVLAVGRAVMLNPIGLVLTAIAAAAYIVWRHWDVIGPKLAAVWQTVKAAFADAWTWISGLPDRMLTVGSQIIDGLLAGMRQRWAALKEGVTGMGSAIAGWFKDKLGIRSPSRVFAEMGGHLMGGLQLGIQRAAGLPLSAMGAVAGALAVPMAAGAMALGSAGAATAGGMSAAPIQITVNLNGAATPEAAQDVAAAVRREVERLLSDRDRRAAIARRAAMLDGGLA